MRDTVHFTVHGGSHRDLCDEADRIISRLLYGEAGEPLPTRRQRWRVVESSMEIHVAEETIERRPVLYSADVTTIIEPPEPFHQEYPTRMRVTLLDEYGTTLFTALTTAGESAEFELLNGGHARRIVVGP